MIGDKPQTGLWYQSCAVTTSDGTGSITVEPHPEYILPGTRHACSHRLGYLTDLRDQSCMFWQTGVSHRSQGPVIYVLTDWGISQLSWTCHVCWQTGVFHRSQGPVIYVLTDWGISQLSGTGHVCSDILGYLTALRDRSCMFWQTGVSHRSQALAMYVLTYWGISQLSGTGHACSHKPGYLTALRDWPCMF